MFVVIGRANRPLGIDLVPPSVDVIRGSVSFGIGGGLFATGLGLIVACSAGLVAAPMVGPFAGATLAGVGMLDIAIGWKKSIAETRKADAETRKLEAERRKLEIEARRIELDERKSEREHVGQTTRGRGFAYSSLVPRTTVARAGHEWGTQEPYATHLLNRSLPTVIETRRYTREIAVSRSRAETPLERLARS